MNKTKLQLHSAVILILTLCAWAYLASCGVKKEPQIYYNQADEKQLTNDKSPSIPLDVPIISEEDESIIIECTVLSEERYDNDGQNTVEVNYLLPNEWSLNAIKKHAEAYGNARRKEDFSITRLFLRYYDYDEEYLYRTHDMSLVDVRLDVRWTEDQDSCMLTAYFRDERYEPTEAEIKLYSEFQEQFFEIAGRYAAECFSRDSVYHSLNAPIYQQVSEKMGVDEETLIDLRIKITNYCLGYMPYCVDED